jgi:hypothetical protein
MTIVASQSISRVNHRRRTGLFALAGLNLAVVVVAAIAPSLNDGVGLEAIHFEAILTALLIFLGVQLAWWLFVDARGTPSPAPPAP